MSRGGDARRELEAEVDHARAMPDGEVDAFGDRGRFAFALAVEDANGHDPCPIGEAGQAVVVVGLLRDRGRDERAVAVAVVRIGVVRDEVVAVHELVPAEVGREAEGRTVRIRDPGVEHGNGHALAPRVAIGNQVAPRFGCPHPELAGEVPLVLLPSVRPRAADAFVVGDECPGRVGDVVGHGPCDAALAPQAARATPRRPRRAPRAAPSCVRRRSPTPSGPWAAPRGLGVATGSAAYLTRISPEA